MGVTLDNELGFKIMTLQSHHLRTEKKVQVLLSVSENISISGDVQITEKVAQDSIYL